MSIQINGVGDVKGDAKGGANGSDVKGATPKVLQSIAKTLPAKKPSGELAAILAQISKDKGPQVAVAASSIPEVERIPTGIMEVDYALGGGFPKGRYSIVYGPESSGKTNLCYRVAAEAQKLPGDCNTVVWLDLEATFSPEWAEKFGIDTSKLVLVRPSYGEEAVDLIDGLLRASEVALLVVDSLAVMVSSKEVEQSAEKFDVGTSALLIKRLCNKVVIALSEEAKRGHTPAVLLINQTRLKIGVMFGDPECLHSDTQVHFVDGTRPTIREVVERQLEGPVWAFNEETRGFEARKILSHHRNGFAKDGEFLTITASSIYGHPTHNAQEMTVSITHKFYVNGQWKPASDLVVGDQLVSMSHTGALSLRLEPRRVSIVSIQPAGLWKYDNREFYDIHVEGLNNYMIGYGYGASEAMNGVLVHNTMPGGQAVKFLSSLTVRLSGKNRLEKEISAEMPAFKDTKLVIKKAKIQVRQYDTEYSMCLLEHDGLVVGETRSWGMVAAHLKDKGLLRKAEKGTGWTLQGKNYQTLVTIQDTYEADAGFCNQLQKLVLASSGKGFTVEASGGAA